MNSFPLYKVSSLALKLSHTANESYFIREVENGPWDTREREREREHVNLQATVESQAISSLKKLTQPGLECIASF